VRRNPTNPLISTDLLDKLPHWENSLILLYAIRLDFRAICRRLILPWQIKITILHGLITLFYIAIYPPPNELPAIALPITYAASWATTVAIWPLIIN